MTSSVVRLDDKEVERIAQRIAKVLFEMFRQEQEHGWKRKYEELEK